MRKLLYIILIVILVIPCHDASAQTSPNGKVRVRYNGGKGQMEVTYKDGKTWVEIMTMPVKLDCDKPVKGKKQRVDYTMVTGKRRNCSNQYVETTYWIDEGHQLYVRAYNDGIAWSTSSKQLSKDGFIVSFASARNNWIMRWVDSYEEFFPLNRTIKPGERYAYPALFEYSNGVFALLSESGLKKTDAASSFYGREQRGEYCIRPDLSIVQPEHHTKVSQTVEYGGWQTLIIGKLADIVESTLITDNSEECQIKDTSWIKPGVASWIYWASNHGSKEFSIIKKYVDMAVEMKLPYVLIDAEWDEMPRIASNEGKTIEDAVRYAVDNGVKPMIWYNSSVGWINGAPGPKFLLNDPQEREKQFAWCEKIGVKGVKIDFFSGDNNMNIAYMAELLECAARHNLLVNFHGVTTMRGWQRTYPNLISAEAVYGAEWYNNVPTFTKKAASHNAMLPFTRNVIGSMDYTPCAFTDSQHPHITTHAHELALTVLFESGIQHLADRPESFLSQRKMIRDFLTQLPTAWDETRYISGYPGETVVLARRSGNVWYVAGINGTDEEKRLDVRALNKLGIGKAMVGIFRDNDFKYDIWGDSPFSTYTYDMEMGQLDFEVCKPRGGFVYKIILPTDE
ncbi:MAG: glycoside hydrolase family 97 catalytic domain-containing protein [Prevotella sp.]|nr:glycoside hydrolase family 97 catalytic domain-containing protein [Candidatus Prevotella equi]